MIRILLVGINKQSHSFLESTLAKDYVRIIAAIGQTSFGAFNDLLTNNNIPCDQHVLNWVTKDVDFIIDFTSNDLILANLHQKKDKQTVIIQSHEIDLFDQLLDKQKTLLNTVEIDNQRINLIFNHIQDGLIVIDKEKRIKYINRNAKKILNNHKETIIGQHISEVYPEEYFQAALQNRRSETYEKVKVQSGEEVITTHIPLLNATSHLIGALAILKRSSEVVNLAEKHTNISKLDEMLSVVTNVSQDAINIVDEHGQDIISNKAFKTLFLHKSDCRAITFLHEQVIASRRPKYNVALVLNHLENEITGSIYPILINGKIKGSIAVINDLSKVDQLIKQLHRSRQIIRQLEATYNFSDIIGQSPRLSIAVEQAKVGAQSTTTLLLRGEDGTEKTLFARAIHQESKRKHSKFIRFNCMSNSKSELTTLLFGCKKTITENKTIENKSGVLEKAHQGTVLLENIDCLSASLQKKIVHFIKTGEITRVGGTRPVQLNTRIIATTSVSVEKVIVNKQLNKELYYLINQLTIYIPPLRKRKKDLPILINHLIRRYNHKYGKNVLSVSASALLMLEAYAWPYNMKELELVLRQIIMKIGLTVLEINAPHLPSYIVQPVRTKEITQEIDSESTDLQQAMDHYEKQFIKRVYQLNTYNKPKTAKALNISLRNLYYKIDKYELDSRIHNKDS